MSLVFASIIPNAPELVRSSFDRKDGDEDAILDALKELEGELYFMKPDTIVFLTSYGSEVPQLMNANIASPIHLQWPEEWAESEELDRSISVDVELGSQMKQGIMQQDKKQLLTVVAHEKVEPEISAPVYMMMNHLQDSKALVISTAPDLDAQAHYDFGERLRHACLETNRRVAVIASGNFGSSADGEKGTSLSELALNFIKTKEQNNILNINASIIDGSDSDMISPLMTIVGCVNNLNIDPQVLAHESRFGVDNAVVNFTLK